MSQKYSIAQEIFHREAIDALEFMEPRILDLSINDHRMYFDLVPRGTYELGGGIVRKQHRFYRDIGDQAGLMDWTAVQVGRDPSGEDAGYDSCKDQGTMINFGNDTVEYTGFHRAVRTRDYCINDYKYIWEYQQQLVLQVGQLATVTREIWENQSAEATLYMAGKEGRIYCMTGANAWSVPCSTQTFSDGTTGQYNPFVSTDLVVPAAAVGQMNGLTKEALDQINEDLMLQAGRGRLAGSSEDPIFGLDIHPWDFATAIEQQSDRREDIRRYMPEVLVEGYMKVKQWWNWALMMNALPFRYNVKAGGHSGTTVTLERVLPWEKQAVRIGYKPVIADAYRKAQYALARPVLKNVFENLVPPSGPGAVASMQFGVVPNHMGDFNWLNYPSDNNPYGEKGRFTARYDAFIRPLEASEWACAWIYKRNVQTPTLVNQKVLPVTTDAVLITAATAVVDTAAGETSTSYTRVDVTLAEALACDANLGTVSFSSDGTFAAVTATAILVNDSDAPTYRIAFATAANWITAGAIVVNTSKIRCGA